MKIAVTYDRGNVGQHFGRTQFFKVFTVEEGNLVKGELVPGGEHGLRLNSLKIMISLSSFVVALGSLL